MADKEPQKERDIGQIVRYLVSTFDSVLTKFKQERAARSSKTGPNKTYLWEREFAYRINELMQGPKCMIQPNITACNEYIEEIHTLIKQEAA